MRFNLSTAITAMTTDGSSITGISTAGGEVGADAVVLAAGAASPLLTKAMGIRIAVYPAKDTP